VSVWVRWAHLTWWVVYACTTRNPVQGWEGGGDVTRRAGSLPRIEGGPVVLVAFDTLGVLVVCGSDPEGVGVVNEVGGGGGGWGIPLPILVAAPPSSPDSLRLYTSLGLSNVEWQRCHRGGVCGGNEGRSDVRNAK
jgi:hypothetical protein